MTAASVAVIGSLLICAGFLTVGIDSQFIAEPCSTYGAVRVVWGQGPFEGNIQICINGSWGWICHSTFRTEDAQVVCRQLGYNPTGAVYRTYAYYGWPNSSLPIWLDGINCVGNETTLLSCPLSKAIGNAGCDHNALAGVLCPSGGPACTNQDIRLINRFNWTPFNNRGRVEVCYNNQWGTVCDDGFSSIDAQVACAQLGFSKNNAASQCCAYYGQGYGSIVMRNLQCNSGHTSLFQCNPTYNSDGCSHSEDVGARCSGVVPGSCTSGSIRLWRGYNIGPAHDGLALYCKNSQWTPICDDYWSCHNARVFCLQLGYAGLLNTRGEYHYGYYQGTVDHYSFSCSSTHTALSQCGYTYRSSCSSSNDQIGIVCYSPVIGSECTDGDVRLVGSNNSYEGRVEFCYEGFWYPVCSLSTYTASLMCKAMGYNSTAASIIGNQRFGRSNRRSSLQYVNCNSTVTSLSQCPIVRKMSGSCRIIVSKCSGEQSLKCHNINSTCTDGDVRLVNGAIAQEGTLEICLNNVWGGACGSLSLSSAFVACRSIGYAGSSPIVRTNAYFGETLGPMLYSNIQCNGWETSVAQCSKTTFPNFLCGPGSSLGVICKDDCTNNEVRLVNGYFENEGTIEVCTNGQWSYIADANFTSNNARVICRQLGYTTGFATPLLGSYFGKEQKPVRYTNVKCFGNETTFQDCSLTKFSLVAAAAASSVYNVASVDCEYDVPTEPPCVQRPDMFGSIPGGSECNNNGAIRLQGGQQSNEGRLEYCYNGYWSPFCKLDPATATVACRQMGYTDYSWGAILDGGEFGAVRNYSLFDNITCTGTEQTISDCPAPYINASCTPWCRLANLGLRCFNKVAPAACSPEGAVRLVDAVIENEGRVEVCVQGVWGAVCDQGWDKTDAHVVCQQLGHPELEPYVFTNSHFGAGQYPIVYTNTDCGGYENGLADCTKQMYPMSACSRSNTAGVLCGYACNDGDVRLVGSQYSYEGTVEVCFDNLWGLIADSGWTQQDAELVCSQLGYETQGTLVQRGSFYGKPAKTIHLSSLECTGEESSIQECTASSLSLEEGKNILAQTDVAGVKCYTPDHCVPPPTGGSSCTNGLVRLTGGQSSLPEGNIEFCYEGTWSPFCYLGPIEATIACRQLGYPNSNLTAVFADGRFGLIPNISLFQNITCSDPNTNDLRTCSIADACMSSCSNALGIRCYEPMSCDDGAVRLVNGTYDVDGRLEVCSDNHWGSVCSIGFDPTDAYVVCNELGMGDSEPTVYNSSAVYGDGDGAIIYSNFDCKGFESSVSECVKASYGTFACTRDRVVGIKCRDSCSDSDVRLVGSTTTSEGIVQVCYDQTWGLVSAQGWGQQEAQVVCNQLGYSDVAQSVPATSYTAPNAPFLLTDVDCTGSETGLVNCSSTALQSPDGGQVTTQTFQPAAAKCMPDEVPDNPNAPGRVISNNPITISMGIVIVILIISVLIAISVSIYVCVKRNKGELSVKSRYSDPHYTMSGLQADQRVNVTNPLASEMEDDTAGDTYNELYGDKLGLVDNI